MRLAVYSALWFAVLSEPAVAQGPSMPAALEQRLLVEGAETLVQAARREGDPSRGAIVFYLPYLSCTKCHGTGDQQSPLGPDLSQPRSDVTDRLLVEAILEPSKTIRQGYESVVVITEDGKNVTGLLAEERAEQLILRDPNDVGRLITLDKTSIEERYPGRVSVMPAGLINALGSRQQFLDLVRYVMEISDRGPRRARQLRPPAALYVAPVLPAYENDLDHAGLIRDWNEDGYRRGEAVYQQLCVNCHGTKDQPGSLPTSLRFASGQFKNGSDPYRLYQTLTKGFGMMMPQTWMVPQQKYDVIHYLREAYLKPHNPSQYYPLDAAYLAQLPAGSSRGPAPSRIEPWVSMDYGPNLNATYEVTRDGTNFAYKGIAVRLDRGPGGVSRGRYWMLFDHDTLRMAAAWSGEGFIDWDAILFNGRHGVHPHLVGQVHWSNPIGPGWASPDGVFADPRLRGRDDKPYGPLPRDWARYRGLYHFGDQVVLSYTVGRTEVLESPGVETAGAVPIFTRAMQLGPRTQPLTLQVARLHKDAVLRDLTESVAVFGRDPAGAEAGAADAAAAPVRFDGRTFLQIERPADFDLEKTDFSITARIKTAHGGTIFCRTAPADRWVPDGQSLFVRDGRLVFDIGWVGAVSSRQKIADGRWHQVALVCQRSGGRVRLYIDGRHDGEGRLQPRSRLPDAVLRIGYTSPNFPEHQTFFTGEIEDLRFYQRQLTDRELQDPQAVPLPDDKLLGRWQFDQARGGRVPDLSGHDHPARVLRGPAAASPVGLVVAGLVPPVIGARWSSAADGSLQLTFPAGQQPLATTLRVASVPSDNELPQIIQQLSAAAQPPDLQPLLQGGAPRWPDKLSTQGLLDLDAGPLAVDVLTHPEQNPWLCRQRLTGFDFFPGGDRAAVCAWDGDVWLVSGLNTAGLAAAPAGAPAAPAPAAGDQGGIAGPAAVRTFPLTWQRIASGLFQPLGLKIVDGRIYVACRDQIVILHDLNGDGETDYYENFNNDHQVTEHFHEFAMGLQRDQQGNFYYAKSARHALPALVPHHGTLLRVSADGLRTEILAKGFRAANGVCLNPDGTFFVTDQEGHWMPKNRINWIDRPGRFYGNMWGYHDVTDPADERMEQPLCWITNAMDRSPAELLWVDSPAWGPLRGSLLDLSYGYGKIYIVPHERVGERMQGGVCEFPLPPFPTGIMRGRFQPQDGQLYTCGMYAWAANPQQPGGFYRIRYTGQPIYLPLGLNARPRGVRITFSGRLDAQTAGDPRNYTVTIWSIRRTANYGSDHFDERRLDVAAARLSEDGRSVELEIPQIQPTWCMEIKYSLRAADGDYVEGKIHNTIHDLPPR